MPATKYATISPDVFARVGVALYGDNWVAPLARDLDMHRRSVEYMRDGKRGIKPGIVTDLLDILEKRGFEQQAIARTLRLAVPTIGGRI